MRLCFGTFARIVCSSRKSGKSNKRVVGTMTRTVDESCDYIDNDSAVTRLLKCKLNLSDVRKRQRKDNKNEPMSLIVQKAEKASRDKVGKNFSDTVLPLIDENKRNQLVFVLCDLICDDTTLDDDKDESFKKHVGKPKDYFDILRKNDDSQFMNDMLWTSFHELLAGIFLYSIIEVDNRVGEKYIDQVDEYIKKHSGEEMSRQAKTEIKTPIVIENLPFFRNRNFTGRGELLNHICEKFADGNTNGHTTQVIYSFDGMGKTSLALEYAYRALTHEKKIYEAICWITCTDEEAIKDSCISFLVKTGITAVLDAASQLNHWLQTNSRWLLILDDVIEETLVEHLMPKMGKEHILITARQSTDFITRATAIKLECMLEYEAADFLIKRTSINDRTNAKLIAERLGYLPLALEQAAAYICKAGIDFRKFSKLLDVHDLKLFDGRYGVSIYEKTIHTVWSITQDRLNDDTKQLLYCFAYLSADSIELDWLKEYAKKQKSKQEKPDVFTTVKQGKDAGKPINVSEIVRKYEKQSDFSPDLILLLTNELALAKALMELINYSIIALKSDYSFTMHTLLQEVIRSGIETPSYLLSVGEVIKERCDYAALIYDDYRIALSLQDTEPLIRNIDTLLKYLQALVKNAGKHSGADSDMKTLEFRLNSFLAQHLALIGEECGDSSAYEEADSFFSKACELALPLYGGGGEHNIVSNSETFTLIQEKHRRMRVNLILERKEVAEAIYEEVKDVLINSIEVNPVMITQAFKNYADLWREFQFTDNANEAEELAAKRGAENK